MMMSRTEISLMTTKCLIRGCWGVAVVDADTVLTYFSVPLTPLMQRHSATEVPSCLGRT